MPLPLLGLLAVPFVQWAVGAVAAAGVGGFAAKKYAEAKSDDQSAESTRIKEAMLTELRAFETALQPLAKRCLESCANIIGQAEAVMISARVATPWNYDGDDSAATLPAQLRDSLRKLESLKFTAIDRSVALPADTVFATAWRGFSGGHVSAIHRFAPQLMPVIAVAWAGSMVADATAKLTAVVQNERTLNDMRRDRAERSAQYTLGLDAARKEIEIIDSVGAEALAFMGTTSTSPMSVGRDTVLRILFTSLYRISPLD
ncbi:MAG: hypothetical protein SGJ21_16045 [Alphaproteobacteria bacterium]|nr:hypothetical protein [Alphaproteobacteria bacterium]